MNEHEIERFARRLGDGAAERLQVEAVVGGVLERLRAGEGRTPTLGWWRGQRTLILRIAAVLAVLAGGSVIARGALERGAAPATVTMPAPVLAGLSSDELEEVFDSLAVEAPVHEFAVGGLESLSNAQLKELLQQMEG